MEHIVGNVAQAVSHEYGEFIKIGTTRVRKSLIIAYYPAGGDEPRLGLVYHGGHPNYSVGFSSKEQVRKECEVLDWIFKGE